ncbi:MAG: hypothetical protein ACI8PZ_001897 [Myxococcota bacterium]|jgi:hypothetical protein
MRWIGVFLSLFVACASAPKDDASPEVCDNGADDDGDGFADCADDDCSGTPACPEVCGDGVDNDGDEALDCTDPDCDGQCPEACDDGRDNDGDGLTDCEDIDCNGQCPEVCDDGRDNDGDGRQDCADEDCFGPTCPEACGDDADNDGDGLLDCDDPDCDGVCAEECDDGRDNDGDGLVDCADVDCDGHRVCPEDCGDRRDNDGDGRIDCEDFDCNDACDGDRDGHDATELGGDDCDDTDPLVNPGQDEVCDGIDNDCNLLIDDDDPFVDPFSLTGWHEDSDLDGFGNPDVIVEYACDLPRAGLSGDPRDCDDLDDAIFPGAVEVCDGVDNDCDDDLDDADASVDESTMVPWHADADGDGFGDAAVTVSACAAPDGFVEDGTDCDDTDPSFSLPEAWLEDVDGDGFGTGVPGGPSCEPPADGWVREVLGVDCNDEDDTIYPDAPEICGDGLDSNCDDQDALIWFHDGDGDGFGDRRDFVVDCDGPPPGYVADFTDCDDTSADIHPDAVEQCDRRDGNCDGAIPPDERDLDGDGYTPCEGDPDDFDPDVFRPACEPVDSFEAGVWPSEGWIAREPGGSISEDCVEGAFCVEDPGWHYKSRPVWGEPGNTLSARVRLGSEDGRVYLGFEAGISGTKSFVLAANSAEVQFQDNIGFGSIELAAAPADFEVGRWYLVEVQSLGGGTMEGRLIDEDLDSLLVLLRHTYDDVELGGTAIRAFGGNRIDDLGVCY